MTHSKVIKLFQEDGKIKSIECLNTLSKDHFHIEAKCFVIACGAIETPRLLFNSRDSISPHGIANQSRTLGQ